MRPLIWLPAAILIGVALWQAIGAADLSPRQAPPPSGNGEAIAVAVEEGEDAGSIAQKLSRLGIIGSARHFRTLVALQGYERQLKAGEYEFDRAMPVALVIHRLVQGITRSRRVSIPEGLRAAEVAELLERRGVVKARDFLAALDTALYRSSVLDGIPPGLGLEGYLFPDTYLFSSQAAAQEVVAALLANLEERLSAELRQEAAAQGLPIHQVLTLASIVEREAALPQERATIASVFRNRLRRGMALDADPTLQYALGSDPQQVAQHGYWKRELSPQDKLVPSPYNTYVNAGLPPGPIANPGLAAITAAIRPAQTDYLYFVAKGDGSHAFAGTLEGHLINVQRYQGGGGP